MNHEPATSWPAVLDAGAAAAGLPTPHRRAARWLGPFLEFLSAIVGFVAAMAAYAALQDFLVAAFDWVPVPYEVIAPVVLFWLAPRLFVREEPQGFWSIFGERFCLGLGIIFIGQATMQYVFHALALPLPLLVAGSVFAAAFTAGIRVWLLPRYALYRAGVLLIGVNPAALEVARAMRPPVLGVLTPGDAQTSGLPQAGTVDDTSLEMAMARLLPRQIIVNDRDWAQRISPRRLIELRQSGVVIRDLAEQYERVFSRVLSDRLRVRDILFNPAFQTKRHTMALQAVYSNLIGLALLAIAGPVLILVSVLLKIAGHRRLLERVTCIGFQGVPFERLHFRVRLENGSVSWAGMMVQTLRFRGLPQIFNLLRGEMGLIGPRPVRAAFVDLLNECSPLHPHRFSVKPGLTGWAQVNLRGSPEGPAEPAALEYDLYYIKHYSLALDLEILVRTAFPGLK